MTDRDQDDMTPDRDNGAENPGVEPEIVNDEYADPVNIWMRGLFMVILALLFAVAEIVLIAFAVLQFLWMLFSRERNEFLAGTGDAIGRWLHDVARFQVGTSEDKPFPWRPLD